MPEPNITRSHCLYHMQDTAELDYKLDVDIDSRSRIHVDQYISWEVEEGGLTLLSAGNPPYGGGEVSPP